MEKINEFLENFPSKNTRHIYRSHLKQYFNFLGADPDTYFDLDRDYGKDVNSYWQSINHRPPKSIKSILSCIKMFLIEYDVEIRPKIWRNINRRTEGSGAVSEDKIPSHTELKEILQHGTIKDRALFLLMCSSGLREGEAIKLRLNDINLDSVPSKIKIPSFNKEGKFTKTGSKRTTFMTEEARDAVRAWLKVREDYAKAAHFKGKGLGRWLKEKYGTDAKPNDVNRIFPFSESTARNMWSRLLNKSGKTERDEITKRYKMRLHTLRKFFEHQLMSKIREGAVRQMMGHEGYLSTYDRYTDEELATEYLKGMEVLLVFETSKFDIEQRFQEQLKSTTNQMQAQIDSLAEQLEWFVNKADELMKYKLKKEQPGRKQIPPKT